MYDVLNKKLYELECELKNLINNPAGCDCEFQTIAEIVAAIEALAGDARLDAQALKNLPVVDGGGGALVDLGFTRDGTTFTITNNVGDNAVVTSANSTEAGALTAAKFLEIVANTAKISADGSINTHSDVDTVTSPPTTGQILQYNGTNWVPANSSNLQPQNLTLTSGVAIFNLSYVGANPPTLTVPSNGVYTITLPVNTSIQWLNTFVNNNASALTGTQEFIVKIDNSANSFNRRFSVEYQAANGALLKPFDFGMNYTQTISTFITTTTVPNANALGTSGFWCLFN